MILKLCLAFVSGSLLTLGPSLTYTAVSWSAVLSHALVSVPFLPDASAYSYPAELPPVNSLGYDCLQCAWAVSAFLAPSRRGSLC